MLDKRQLKRTCLWCAILFLLIFGIRLIYQLGNGEIAVNSSMLLARGSNDQAGSMVKNYASSKMEYAGTQGEGTQVVDQKYEKIATLISNSEKYDEDEASLYNIIEENKCVIQLENKSGLKGNRQAEMVIGVKPDHFDETIKEFRSIGKITSQKITKADKTGEYRQMIADKSTLEKTKESYIALRVKGGSITELLTLEQNIIEIEGQIQKQSVDLGEYSDDNAFCTINFSLQEKSGKFSIRNVCILQYKNVAKTNIKV